MGYNAQYAPPSPLAVTVAVTEVEAMFVYTMLKILGAGIGGL